MEEVESHKRVYDTQQSSLFRDCKVTNSETHSDGHVHKKRKCYTDYDEAYQLARHTASDKLREQFSYHGKKMFVVM